MFLNELELVEDLRHLRLDISSKFHEVNYRKCSSGQKKILRYINACSVMCTNHQAKICQNCAE